MSVTLEQVLGIAAMIGKEVVKSKDAQKVLFGKYTDGKTRSFADAIYGVYDSPKTKKKKQKYLKDFEKRHKKQNKKKKKKKTKLKYYI